MCPVFWLVVLMVTDDKWAREKPVFNLSEQRKELLEFLPLLLSVFVKSTTAQ